MKSTFFIVIAAFALTSCSQYQKVLKNEDVKAKYDLAQELYEQEDYKRANRLLQQITPKYAGKPQGERIMFFSANSNFELGDYNTAGYEFERFIKSYPKSDKVAEAAFLGAKSYYELSPEYSLDQADTDKALLKLQNFVNAYSESEYFEEANLMTKELTIKKEKKAFEIARQFNKIGEFDLSFLIPAMSAFDNFISDYPGSVYREAALFYKFEAATRYGLNSFQNLKKERLLNAKGAYLVLKKQFPETAYTKEADKWLSKIDKELQEFSTVSN